MIDELRFLIFDLSTALGIPIQKIKNRHSASLFPENLLSFHPHPAKQMLKNLSKCSAARTATKEKAECEPTRT
jgi:hypothetical protein